MEAKHPHTLALDPGTLLAIEHGAYAFRESPQDFVKRCLWTWRISDESTEQLGEINAALDGAIDGAVSGCPAKARAGK